MSHFLKTEHPFFYKSDKKKKTMKRSELKYRVYLVILFLVFIIGMIGLIEIEHLDPVDALYFIVATVSTVGYGDVHPVTYGGKFLAIVIILAGVGCFVGVVANSIEYMIERGEKRLRDEKLNMIIGIFFSEVGTDLLKTFSVQDPKIEEIRSALIVSNNWSESDFSRAVETLKHRTPRLDSRIVDLEDLNIFFTRHKGFLLSLLENPQMIEHESFVPLLLAVFHLEEELHVRKRLTDLPSSDYDHLTEDINQIYGLLIVEWLTWMKNLKQDYPHFFSLAMRTNPFDANASPILE
jgi:voltage-gated potassium channel